MTELPKAYGYDNGYIHLANLRFRDLPNKVIVKGNELQLKTELHISLICAKRIAAIIDEEQADKIEAEIVDEFVGYVAKTPLDSYRPLKVFRFVQRDEKKTVIMMVEVPKLDKFFALLSEKYKKDLPLQPTHVTLYTLQPEVGIGILSNEQLEADSEPVELEELKDNSLYV